MTIKIKEGGRIDRTTDDKITEFIITNNASDGVNFYIETKNGFETLSYLSLNETLEIKRALQEAINKIVNN